MNYRIYILETTLFPIICDYQLSEIKVYISCLRH